MSIPSLFFGCLDWRGVVGTLKMKTCSALAHGCYLFTPRVAAKLEHGGRDDACPAVLSAAKHGLTVGCLMPKSYIMTPLVLHACFSSKAGEIE